MDFDSQLIESVEVRRSRLTSALLFGANPTERRWRDRTRILLAGVAAAALVCALCVGISFVAMVITDWLTERQERERQTQSLAAVPLPIASPSESASESPFPLPSPERS